MKDFTFQRQDCIWDHLKSTDKPIVLYGTGNGADKIIDQCEKRNIRIDGIFASDGFVRNRVFRSMPVESYASVCERLGDDIIILMSFGSNLPEIADRCRALAEKHEFYVPEVPLYPSEVFDFDYYETYINDITRAAELFEDDYSKSLFYDMIAYRMTGKLEYLSTTETLCDSLSSLFDADSIHTIVDAGAFNGDTARIFADTFPTLKMIYALEPDSRTFRKLSAYADTEKRCAINAVNSAAYDRSGGIEFESSGSRGSGTQGMNNRSKTAVVDCITIDEVANGENIDLIKYDVEGDEEKAIDGSSKVITDCAPSLIVSLYHRTHDIFTLPLKIKGLLPNAKFYLRRVPCIPAWDLTLVAVSDNHKKI